MIVLDMCMCEWRVSVCIRAVVELSAHSSGALGVWFSAPHYLLRSLLRVIAQRNLPSPPIKHLEQLDLRSFEWLICSRLLGTMMHHVSVK